MTTPESLIQDKSLIRQKKETFKKWLLASIAVIIFLYLSFSFLAPVLMKHGHQSFAKTLYKIYRPACHQLAYRSFFLYGEQAVYPRALAGMKGLKTYEEVSGADPADTVFASKFVGDEKTGYKVVLCQRDTAIYAGLLIFIIAYWISGNRIKAIPWYLWILLAIAPIGLDGFWQLFSQLGMRVLSWLPARESTPYIRVLTGAFFGIFSAWFIVPTFRGDEDSQPLNATSIDEKVEAIELGMKGQVNEED